jgi:hypothetical protein
MKSLGCKLKDHPWILLLGGLLLLLLLFLLRRWLFVWLLLYLAILIWIGLLALVRVIQGIMRKECRPADSDTKGQGSAGHPPSTPIYVPPHTYKRPDPMIYSQYFLATRGIAVTWDNPDIQLFDGTTPVPSFGLSTKKTYTIRARIWNGSVDAPAVNMLVQFFYLSFGIGTVKNYIGQMFVDVPVKGAVGSPATAELPWTTPATSGHYCIQVQLLWPDDANPDNNLGQENVDVKKTASPATFKFQLRNDAAARRTLTLRADAYAIPPKAPCNGDVEPSRIVRDDPYAAHRVKSHPVPADWHVDIQPGEGALGPGQDVEVTVVATPPAGFSGRQAINVNGFDDTTMVGGVTLYAES